MAHHYFPVIVYELFNYSYCHMELFHLSVSTDINLEWHQHAHPCNLMVCCISHLCWAIYSVLWWYQTIRTPLWFAPIDLCLPLGNGSFVRLLFESRGSTWHNRNVSLIMRFILMKLQRNMGRGQGRNPWLFPQSSPVTSAWIKNCYTETLVQVQQVSWVLGLRDPNTLKCNRRTTLW